MNLFRVGREGFDDRGCANQFDPRTSRRFYLFFFEASAAIMDNYDRRPHTYFDLKACGDEVILFGNTTEEDPRRFQLVDDVAEVALLCALLCLLSLRQGLL
mgnify:CR=1 FL=1